jgi:hypothetical protein
VGQGGDARLMMPFPADPGFALGYDIPYQDGLAVGAS